MAGQPIIRCTLVVTVMSPTVVDWSTTSPAGQFHPEGATITGRDITFWLSSDADSSNKLYPYFFDRISASVWFGMWGTVKASVSESSAIDGLMSGEMGTWAAFPSSPLQWGAQSGACRGDHQVSFRR